MLEVQVILREGIQNWSIRFNSVSSNKVSPFSSVKSLKSRVQLFATPRTVARQASLFITNFPSLLKLMSIELVMPSNHLIFCHTRYPPKAYVTRLLLTPQSPFWMKIHPCCHQFGFHNCSLEPFQSSCFLQFYYFMV